MSEGLIDASALSLPEPVEPSMITPSMTKIGSLEAFKELIPRIRMEELPPGIPLLACTCTPAARPCSTWSTEVTTDFLMASSLTDTTEPVRSLRFI